LGFDVKDKERSSGKPGSQVFLDLLKEAPQAIVAHDARGKIIVWSRGAERMLGYREDEIVGKNFSKLLPRGIKMTGETVAQVLSGEVDAFELQLVSQDGRLIDVFTMVSPLKDEEGNLIAIIRMMRDITERKRAEREMRISEEQKRLILDNIRELIAFQDVNNRVLAANRAAGDSVGQRPEQLVGRFCYEIWHQRDKPCLGCPVVVARKTGQPAEAEITSPDGRVWHIRGYPVKDESGRVTGVIEITSEITERKMAEQSIQRAREFAEAIVETVREPLVVLDAEMRVIAANRSFYQTFQVVPEKTEGSSIYEISNGAWNIPKLRELLENILPNNTSFDNFEVEHDFPTIGRRVMLLNARRIYSKGNKTLMVLLAIEDITERRQAEEKLQKSEKRYRMLVEMMNDGLSMLDQADVLIYVNDRYCEMLGYPREELIGRPIYNFIDPGQRDKVHEMLEKERKGERTVYESAYVRKDGQKIFAIVSATPIFEGGRYLGSFAVVTDITRIKMAEEKLRESEEKYRSLVEYSADSIYMLDRELRYLFANEALLRRLGLPREEVLGRKFGELHTAEETEEFAARAREVFETGRAVQQEHWSDRLKGVFLRTLSPITDPRTGEIGAITVVSKEITDLKRMEMALRQSSERLRAIIDFSPDGIVITDPSRRIIDCNRALLKLLNLTKEEIVGKDILEFISPKLRVAAGNDINEAAAAGSRTGLKYDLVNGLAVPSEISIATIPDPDGKPTALIFVVRDITERVKNEEKMRELIYRVNDIVPGECYLLRSHKAAFIIFSQLTAHGVPGICFSREKPEELMKYGVPKEKTVFISSVPLAGFETIDGLQQISIRIAEFLKENKNSVVLLDGLEYLVSRIGFDSVYRFLQEKRFSFFESKAVLLIPVDLSAFDDRERSLLASEINIVG